MNLSRRQFHKYSARFLMGGLFPGLFFNLFNRKLTEQEVNENFNKIIGYLTPGTDLLVPTFLGNPQRRFYGRGVPGGLNIIHKFPLGTGVTYVGSTRKVWSGAGWTGQPTITRDRGRIYLVIGSYDYHLRKIDFETNEEVWKYKFDDVIKGSSSIYLDETASENNQIVILQGSRTGRPKNGIAPSFRAISFRTGQELWKLDIRKTASYSRDNDSSALDLGNGVIFNAGENGVGYFLDSRTTTAQKKSGFLQPKILSEVKLYSSSDSKRQGGNIVSESSPSRLDNRLFLASGSGHIYGISLDERKIIWDFYTGSDLDGTVAISKQNKLFCAIEKEFLPGQGGVIKLNPEKPPQDSVEWFLPTGNTNVASWKGGIIGSVALNDEYNPNNFPALFATNAIDGYLYIGSQDKITGKKVKGPLLKRTYDTPVVVFKQRIGASISTPIFTEGYKLVTAGYGGVYLFNLYWEEAKPDDTNALENARGEYYRLKVEQVGRFKPDVSFESTPVVWDNKIIICGRDGWLYTLGS
ncbi:PQQ-binding-like beta-propeller repeat protein [Capilliphycus salinus ALCB114379]|uniref:outer membrane protein assembly factor BamB family protein n=1 Tax=Capilliphycus salinus TaxID=2768948 RepID=UPI0039A50400